MEGASLYIMGLCSGSFMHRGEGVARLLLRSI